jgi:O-antigen/teichoic acid export membrane protein
MSDWQAPIPELDAKGLREFGFIMAAAIALLFGLFLPWWFEKPWPAWPWLLAAFFVVWALAAPTTLRRVYRGWMHFGRVMGRIVTPLILTATFFIAIVPTGLIMRALGKDPMRRHFDPDADSYLVDSEAAPAERLERPF